MAGYDIKKGVGVRRLTSTYAFISIVTLCALLSCSSRDSALEANFSKQLAAFKKSDAAYLDLIPIFGDQWERICIQSPYMDQDQFEKLVGQKVTGFEYVGDEAYVFWVFYRDGKIRWARIGREMDRHPSMAVSCTDLDDPRLYAESHAYTNWEGDRARKYFFSEKRR